MDHRRSTFGRAVELAVAALLSGVLVGGGLACSTEDDRAPRIVDSRYAIPPAAQEATPSPARTDTVVAQPVHWDPHLLQQTLRAAGFAPGATGLHEPDVFPNVPAAAYRVGTADVSAFFFGDPLAAAQAIARRARAGEAGGRAFTSNNMVVLVRGDSALRARIERLLTAPETRGTRTP